ncbi:6-phosphogluconolactonase [Methylocucumis oryzae]|uniref:6-phosphogluconolactonase n=1 Tax=Methylocucumis oryzae TaxID=1632867 RepID=UPI000AE666D7|nr:6-phosphogluconolactonase [Methylocucumis oryzae]
MQENSRWRVFDNSSQVAEAAYHHILSAANQAIAEHGSFKLVLAGGSTPEKSLPFISPKQHGLVSLADLLWR